MLLIRYSKHVKRTTNAAILIPNNSTGKFKISNNKQIQFTPKMSLSVIFSYFISLIIIIDIKIAIIIAIYMLNKLVKKNEAIIIAIPGIGKPTYPSISSESILYLVNLNTPQISMNNDAIIVKMSIYGAFKCPKEYKNAAGATPNDTISDNESIFFPNS